MYTNVIHNNKKNGFNLSIAIHNFITILHIWGITNWTFFRFEHFLLKSFTNFEGPTLHVNLLGTGHVHTNMADKKCNLARNTFLVYIRFLVFTLLCCLFVVYFLWHFLFCMFFFRVCVCVLCPTECAALNMKLSKLSKNILIQLETSQPRVLNVEFLFVIAVEGSSVEENSPKISKTTKMVFDCGVWCAKYLLCIFNFIFFVSTDEVMWEGGLLCYMHQVMHMGNA